VNPAVVLGLCPTGLAVIHALGRCGVPVWGTDTNRWAPGFRSSWLKSLGEFAPQDDDRLIARLQRLHDDTGAKPVLYATSDDYLEFIARNDDRLQHCALYPELNSERLSTYINKRTFYTRCEAAGILIPETFYFDSRAELEKIAVELPYPVILKPIRVHIWDRRFKGQKAIAANSVGELMAGYRRVEAAGLAGEVMVQRLIGRSDRDIRIYAAYVDRQGNIRNPFSGWKLRQIPPRFGTTAAARMEVDEAFQARCAELLRTLDHRGLCDVEFKREPQSGREYVMEVNPRTGRWYKLVESSTGNLPLVCYNDLTGLDIKPSTPRKADKWFFVGRDLASGLYYLVRGELTPGTWWRDYRGAKSWALWEPRDPNPFFFAPITWLATVVRSLWRRWGRAR